MSSEGQYGCRFNGDHQKQKTLSKGSPSIFPPSGGVPLHLATGGNAIERENSRDTRASTSLRRDRSKKRRRSSNPFESENKEAAKTSASSKKLEGSKDHDVTINDSIGYVIMNFLCFPLHSACVKCKQCGNDVTKSTERKANTYEVNQTFIFAMRLLGIGLVGKTRFCRIMDLHRPIFQTTYGLIVNSLESAPDACGEKLTGRLINELTVYYGFAIRRNSDSVEKIKDAIRATIFHKSSTDEEPNHDKCPPGQES
ncbi:hypothetical protein J437_LFUL009921 [Ladona fulva]|uniref:Uncharacterized protein n=1 Tax=Ladona fulva TaxID=123851 RepID=A0A8K0KD24_LADFU|nr:hypothetical protein J437_LFUL009921 [Ladona fulva]